MRIVIDMLGAQSDSAERGIGRYSLMITRAILHQPSSNEYWIAINSYCPERVDKIKEKLTGLIAEERYLYYSTPFFDKGESLGEKVLARYAEDMRERAILSVQPDAVYMPSLFESYGEPLVSSVNRYGSRCLYAVTLHDLIPFLNQEKYLADRNMYNWYMRKINELQKADLLFSVSASAKNEAVTALNFPEDRIINSGSGVNKFFSEQNYTKKQREAFCCKFGITKKFVMYAGAADSRKNLNRLIEAFALLPKEVRGEYELVFVSKINDDARKILYKCAADNGVEEQLVITGYVSDEELRMAYHFSCLFVFPSLHEGFGLPVAEASLCGNVVIGSNRTSIPEIICMPEAMFNPEDTHSMMAVMLQALTDEQFRQKNRELCRVNCQQFTGEKVAERLLAGLEDAYTKRCQQQVLKSDIAMLLPLGLSAADRQFFMERYTELCEKFNVELVYLSPEQDAAAIRQLQNRYFAKLIWCISGSIVQNKPIFAGMSYYSGSILVSDSSEPSVVMHYEAYDKMAELYQRYGFEAVLQVKYDGIDGTPASYPLALPIENVANSIIAGAVNAAKMKQLYPFMNVINTSDTAWAEQLSRETDRIRFSDAFVNGMVQRYGKPNDAECCLLADALAKNVIHYGKKRLFVDITILAKIDAKTGIQRVVRNNLSELMQMDLSDYRIEPVVYDNGRLRYQRAFACGMFDIDEAAGLKNKIVEPQEGDIFLGLDLNLEYIKPMEQMLRLLQTRGVKLHIVVYDLLPNKFPQFFLGAMPELYTMWLNCIVRIADRLICISKAVADELYEYVLKNKVERVLPLHIDYFHLGADLKKRASKGFSDSADILFQAMEQRKTFLMVSTLEPRKGYNIIVQTFEQLWHEDVDVNLVIVGKKGWLVDTLIKKIKQCSELNKRLFWLEGISDEFLDAVYAKADALIAASYGEGFGLPIIEAAQHGTAVIARDIPVFREVAGDNAVYFKEDSAEEIAAVIKTCLKEDSSMTAQTEQIKWLTWQESTQQLIEAVRGNKAYRVYQGADKE